MTDKLTTKAYWETYYRGSHVSEKHIVSVCSYYDRIWDIFVKKGSKNEKLIEIGGFPGRYLAYLSKRHYLNPTCLDYNSDFTQVKGCFDVMNVSNYHIIQKDFTTYRTAYKYDYVMSNGFIEHFENYDKILDLHVDYLADKGRLLIMIPNMKGYIKFYKYLVDYNNLKIHNLNTMRLSVFKNFAKRHNLSILYLGYYGGFPLNVHQKNNFIQKLIYKSHRLIFKYFGNSLLLKYPSKYFSSSIIGVFERQ